MNYLSSFGAKHARFSFWATAITCIALILLVLAPTLSPTVARILHPLTIDTDPENMLPEDEGVRVFHNTMKDRFGLHDFIVVGIVNDARDEGVFTPESLEDVYALTETAAALQWEDKDGNTRGVVRVDVIAPSMVDNIEQAGLGAVRFEWLMESPPKTEAEAQAVAEKARNIPMFDDTLVSGDGRALALYLPIYKKRDSYRVAQTLRAQIDTFENGDTYHITGLSIAQDQFGVEMFIQMAISAPAAMILIFGLMWAFFRNVKVIVAPMIVAMASVLMTMGLLIVTGNTIHIMASMIPVFIMPIAVLDAVHVLSEFHDRYRRVHDRLKTLQQVMKALWRPMLFTSLTTAVGFASLAFADIPPVQVFGIFVAIGVMIAWALTVILVPAYIMSLAPETLERFGQNDDGNRALPALGQAAFRGARVVVIATVALYGLAYYGISQITINDNPVKWFEPDHDIRVADRALNKAFGGTYMAYIGLEAEGGALAPKAADMAGLDPSVARALLAEPDIESMRALAEEARFDATTDDAFNAWDAALMRLDEVAQKGEVFKDPAVLGWIDDLQSHLLTTGFVGKSNGVTEIVKTVHRELKLGETAEYRIPDSPEGVAETLLTFQSSHRPNDLWHFVTPDYRSAAVWMQLTSGDNKDMQAVVDAVEAFVAANPAPVALSHDWFGLTYINVVWQQKMVEGMRNALISSFVVVMVMLMVLFRSPLWGLVSMIPLTLAIGLIYGLIGLIGKDYDMPIAVLSSLSLGLSVDYAIHFVTRSREISARLGSWQATIPEVFGEPGRAIFRNVIVVGVGFTPLILAPLTPYQTVGVFISLILLISGIASLLILPALITLLQKWLFPGQSAGRNVLEAAE